MSIQTIGIIGAGTMGNGIAQACAVAGLNAVVQDVSEAALERALKTVSGSLDRSVRKGTLTEADKDTVMSRIKTSTSADSLAGTDLIIEAATENQALKVKILQQLDGLLAVAGGAFAIAQQQGTHGVLGPLAKGARHNVSHAQLDEWHATPQRLAAIRAHDEFFTYIVRDDAGQVLLQGRRARGVRYRLGRRGAAGSQGGVQREARCRGEVVLCAGDRKSVV